MDSADLDDLELFADASEAEGSAGLQAVHTRTQEGAPHATGDSWQAGQRDEADTIVGQALTYRWP